MPDALHRHPARVRTGRGETLPLTDRFGGVFFFRFPKVDDDAERMALIEDFIAAANARPESERVDLAVALGDERDGVRGSVILNVPTVPEGQQAPEDLGALPRRLTSWRRQNPIAEFLLHLYQYARHVRTGLPDLMPYFFEEGVDRHTDSGPEDIYRRGEGLLPMRDVTLEALTQRSAIQPCTLCGSTKTFYGDELYAIIERRDYAFGRQGRPMLPVVPVTCTNCGLVRLHASQVLGLTKMI